MIPMPSELPHPQLTPNIEVVLKKRYLRKDPEGLLVEEPRDLFWRVAAAIAAEDGRYGVAREAQAALARPFGLLRAARGRLHRGNF